MDSAVLLESLEARWPIIASAALAGLVAILLPRVLVTIRMWQIPMVGSELGSHEKRRQAYLAGARKVYNEGYKKFKDGVFRITTSRDTSIIILSPKFLPELKKLPDTIVSMEAAVDEAMEVKYTKIETHVPIIPYAVKSALTPGLVRLNPSIAEEVQEAFGLEIPACPNWTSVNIHHKLLRIIGMVSGRVFIGPELCRSEQYLDAAINYTLEVMAVQKAVSKMRPWLRPFLARRLPQLKTLEERIARAHEFIDPVVKLRKEAAADPSFEKPDDLLQWLLDVKDKFPDANSQNLTKVQLGATFAAIHTTVLAATNAFYSIAALPELVPELREEVRQVLEENGGIFTSNALQNMKKLDSFLKEVMRFYPATMASFQRKVLQPFTLSNGQFIPAGVTIEVPTVAVNADSNVFEDAEKFDALRFYRVRQQAKETGSAEGAALNQFVSVSQSSLTFGYGRHACPGRFFAANELKMVMANALLKYDIKNADGRKERYPNIEFGHMCIPDPSKELLFKELAL